MRRALWLLAPLALVAAPAAADVLVVGAEIDNSMYEESDNSNGQGPHLYAGQTAGGFLRRALVRFDVGALPVMANILDVQLEVRVNQVAPASGVRTYTLQRVTAEWGEGDSNAGEPGGIGAPAAPGDATWEHRLFPGDAWASPGGDFEAALSASTDIDGPGAYVFTGQGLVDDVQAWVNGDASNYGWIVRGDESTFLTAKRFYSSEHTAGGPVLTITYEQPSTPTQEKSWSSIKGTYAE